MEHPKHLKEILSLPPGLIVLRYADVKRLAELLLEIPPDLIRELRSQGYTFIALPSDVRIEHISDQALDKICRERKIINSVPKPSENRLN